DDYLEIAVDERVLIEEPLAVDDESRVRIASEVLRPVIEADPGGRHRVGVDVVEQNFDAEVLHLQVELAAKLLADELRILGEEEDALAGSELDEGGRFHRLVSICNGRTAAPSSRKAASVLHRQRL